MRVLQEEGAYSSSSLRINCSTAVRRDSSISLAFCVLGHELLGEPFGIEVGRDEADPNALDQRLRESRICSTLTPSSFFRVSMTAWGANVPALP